MREILFRGRTKDGKWCYGDYVHAIRFNGVRGFHKDWIIPGVYGNGGWISMRGKDAVDGDTVGQYSGFCDFNGMRIFEGDIVQNHKKTKKFVVFWSEFCGMFGLKELHDDDSDFCNYSGHDLIVIGNIYDNVELLEEESDGER